ncbi:MAG: DNA-3-methyladenine glycosylase 2 family protein [Actinobacteria bacterium]|nr:DNA-3-methyladenine glycosylase 2 family protein [Actinomycetota bacterium]
MSRGHQIASRSLAELSPVTASMLDRYGPMRSTRGVPVEARFASLARTIAYQQLAGRAASTIWSRVVDLVAGPFTPEAVLALDPSALRGAGLSTAKTLAVLDLAAHVADGRLSLHRLGRMDDEAVISHLVAVRGIGPWTAQMFLMNELGRLDIWPTGDLGVRTGFALAFDLDSVPSPAQLEELGDQFRPYRSVLAWYCWRVADDPARARTK